jgi:hypothetical protein
MLTSLLTVVVALVGLGYIPSVASSTLTVEQIRNPAYTRSNYRATLDNIHQKYGSYMSPSISFSKRDTGSVMESPEFLTPVQIGTPPKTFNVEITLDFSNFWVWKSQLGRTVYSPSQSSTAEKTNESDWQILYDGRARNLTAYMENVTIGNLTVPKQAVLAVAKLDSNANYHPFQSVDGVLGLGFSDAVFPGFEFVGFDDNLWTNHAIHTGYKTWFENIMSSLDKPVFAIDAKYTKCKLRASRAQELEYSLINVMT